MDIDELVGARVLLRPFRVNDVPAVLAYASDPEVTRHLEWDAYDDPATAESFIRSTQARSTVWYARAIVLHATGQVIGGADLRVVSPRDRRAEIGYGLARAYWGHGYAAEAAGLLVRFGFEQLDLVRIQAVCAVDNERSARTPTSCRSSTPPQRGLCSVPSRSSPSSRRWCSRSTPAPLERSGAAGRGTTSSSPTTPVTSAGWGSRTTTSPARAATG